MILELDPGLVASAGVAVTAGALVPLPDDQPGWMTDALRAADLEVVADDREQTTTGWPLRIVVSRAGAVWRAHGFYAFLEHAAVATLTADSRAAIEQARGLLRSGRPRWTTGVAALSELWDCEADGDP